MHSTSRLVVCVCVIAGESFARPTAMARAITQSAVTVTPVTAIDVEGAAHLNRDQIVALSGLVLGQRVSTTDLDGAVSKMMDTGLFNAVHYRVQSTSSSTRVTLEVVEPLWTLAVLLDNFIWFRDDEIYQTIAREIPTFDGAIPETEGAKASVTNVLQRMLGEHHLAGTVEHQPYIRLADGRVKERYWVDGVHMPVCAIHFPGATGTNAAELLRASKFLVADQYSRERLFRTVAGNLVPVYKERGYLQAEFRSPDATHVSTSSCADGVDVVIAVTEGPIFFVKAVTWSGNTSFSSSALDLALAVRSGERADMTKFGEGLEAVKAVYEHAGFLDFSANATPHLDPDAGKVSFDVEIAEHAPYLMGDLTFDGFSPSDITRLSREWPIKKGQPFDLPAAKGFPGRVAVLHLAPAGKKISAELSPSPDTHVVHVKLVAR